MSKKNLFLSIIIIIGLVLTLPLLTVIGKKDTAYKKMVTSTSSVSRGEAGLVESIVMPDSAPMMDNFNPSVSREIMPVPADSGKFAPTQDRTIVKQASLSLLVNDTRKFVDQATETIKQMNGFVTSANIFESEPQSGAVNADLTMRVPIDKLEDTLKQLKSFASKITAENVTAEDKTEQKVDLEAQISNLQATEQQLLTIMKEARTVEDTLKVQAQLTQTRDRIERFQASLENLEGSAAMSTIHVSVSTKEAGLPIIKPTQTTIWEEVKMATRDAITMYRGLLVVGLRLLVLASPLIIIGSLGWLVAKKRK